MRAPGSGGGSAEVVHQHQFGAAIVQLRIQRPTAVARHRKRGRYFIDHGFPWKLPDDVHLVFGEVIELKRRSVPIHFEETHAPISQSPKALPYVIEHLSLIAA